MTARRSMVTVAVIAAAQVVIASIPSNLNGDEAVRRDTAALQRRIDDAAAAGGGTVRVSAGRHVVGGIFLRSNVTLHLEKGAVLEGFPDTSFYPGYHIPNAEMRTPWQALVTATNASNVAVTGEGRIFGNGARFPVVERPAGRPRGLVFLNCRNVRVEGVTISDPACWSCYFRGCDGVVARDVTIDAHANYNNDGFDIDSVNVLIERCTVDAGDDGICLKSDDPDRPTENVEVRDCRVSSTCNALKIGTGSHGGFRNVVFHDCETRLCRRVGTGRPDDICRSAGYHAKRWPGSAEPRSSCSAVAIENVDGGELDGVTFRNIRAEGSRVPVFIRAGLRERRACGIPFGTRRVTRNILVENVKGRALSRIACSLTGVPGHPLRNVTLRNVEIAFPGGGDAAAEQAPVPERPGAYPEANMFDHRALPAACFYVRHAEEVDFENVRVSFDRPDGREPFVFDDVKGGRRDLRISAIGAVMLSASGDGCVEELAESEKSQLLPWQLWARPEPFALPDMFLSETGRRVTTREEWERVRRPEIRRWFETHMHGVRPVERPDDLTFAPLEPDREILGGRAVRKNVRIGYRGAFGEGGFNVTAYVPAGGRPTPAFVLMAGVSLRRNLDAGRSPGGYFPVEEFVRRGYAAIFFVPMDVAHDEKTHSLTGGVFAVFGPKERTRTSWGAISAWAWGASRVLDWIETVPELDAKHVAIAGQSRCGKTALYAAAVDERFAMACVNDSGCCGAKLNHAQVPMSENIELDNVVNPHWFCRAYRDWDNRDHEVPYDQHELAALIAPRLLAIGSASDDIPSGPYGEYLTAKYCSPAWELYGKKGLAADPEVEARRGFRGFPPYDTAINAGCVSYHLRKGEHLLDAFDWTCYMDFADRHGWRGGKGKGIK